MYKDFDNENVKVIIHGHYRNSSVNRYLVCGTVSSILSGQETRSLGLNTLGTT